MDYAHTPDGLDNILAAVRGFAKGRVITVFGCGGDRDPSKRPLMGLAAGKGSDLCVVTTDNPRTEEPMAIIEQILPGLNQSGCEYYVVENRKQAIAKAMSLAKENDVVLLAGKGHEPYQEINGVRHPFDEKQIVQDILQQR
ncbi:MAG: glutamate ligase domain-containing protein [Christensenellales bacterium]